MKGRVMFGSALSLAHRAHELGVRWPMRVLNLLNLLQRCELFFMKSHDDLPAMIPGYSTGLAWLCMPNCCSAGTQHLRRHGWRLLTPSLGVVRPTSPRGGCKDDCYTCCA